jgi:methylated-DNA-[protein]-cysteine S-methyltransferase
MTPIGEFILGTHLQKICLLDFKHRRTRQTIDNRLKKKLKTTFIEKDTPLLSELKINIDHYLFSKQKQWNFPLLLIGTPFQKKVWNEILKVPYGKTMTYLQLAKNIGCEKSVRAVANANGANAIGLIIPCHRIIGSNGTLTGYAGGLDAKKHLLTLESSSI